MSLRFLLTLVVALALVAPVLAQKSEPVNVKPAPSDGLAALLDKLHNETVSLPPGANLNDMPLMELLLYLSKTYNVTFVILEEPFKEEGITDIRDKKTTLAATSLRGLTLHEFLTKVLENLSATYLVKGNTIKIVPTAYAAKVTGTGTDQKGDKSIPQPLVSAVIKEKPLNEAVAQLAEWYDLTAIVAPQAGDGRKGPVTARLLNVPASTALELLAVQCDLRVVRQGNAFLITSREHAHELFNEKLERERLKIELQKFRDAPPPRPEHAPLPKGPPGELELNGNSLPFPPGEFPKR